MQLHYRIEVGCKSCKLHEHVALCATIQGHAMLHYTVHAGFQLTLIKQGPTNIFDKTCSWVSGMKKPLAQQDELVVPYHDGSLAIEVWQTNSRNLEGKIQWL